MTGKIFGAIIIVLLIAAAAWIFWPKKTTAPNDSGADGVVCTMDAMQCPDGSWVGRTGPNCQFVCPGQ